MTKSWHKNIALFSAVLLTDRLSKAWVMSGQFIDKQINSWLSLTKTLNRGISFSLLSFESVIWYVVISLLVAGVCAWLAYYAYQRWQQGYVIGAEVLVLAGAASNLIDRIWYGGVVDFIEISYTTSMGSVWVWPVFNIADCAIVMGLLLMCIKGLYDE